MTDSATSNCVVGCPARNNKLAAEVFGFGTMHYSGSTLGEMSPDSFPTIYLLPTHPPKAIASIIQKTRLPWHQVGTPDQRRSARELPTAAIR